MHKVQVFKRSAIFYFLDSTEKELPKKYHRSPTNLIRKTRKGGLAEA